jgi:uracil-DNA glycosylase
MLPPIPGGWPELAAERREPYFRALEGFLRAEYANGVVYPPPDRIFQALERTPRDGVRVILLGQDPYHGPGQAHGLAFSVPPGTAKPPSLRNLLRELNDDLGVAVPEEGTLVPWARRGVLLLNTTLTVREGEAGSHAGRGWERFTDAVVRAVAAKRNRVVFLLLGRHAQRKVGSVDLADHAVVTAAHPSPLSAHRGFFGSRVFSRTNEALKEGGEEPIDWELSDRAG